MQHDTMPAPMFTYSVPTLPPKDLDPTDIHLDTEITNDTTRSYDPFAPVKARLTSVGMHVDNEPAERDSKDTHKVHSQPSKRANQAIVKDQMDMNAVETAPGAEEQPLTPASTDTDLESAGTQKVIDTSEGVAEADDHAPVLERPEPISPSPSDISNTNYTTCERPKDALLRATAEVNDAVATAGHENVEEPVPTSAEPEAAQAEFPEAEVRKPNIIHPEVIEAGISEPGSAQSATAMLGAEDTVVAMPNFLQNEAAQPTDSHLVPGQSTEIEIAGDHMPNEPSMEGMSTTDDPHQEQDARRPTSPTCEPAAADDSSSETAKSSDTNEQVAWLRNKYQSFEESRSSENEEEKVQEKSATNTHTPPYTINNGIEDTGILENNGAAGKTSKSTLVDHANSTTVVMPRISLFGDPSSSLAVIEPRISLFCGPSSPKPVIEPRKSEAADIEAERVAGPVAEGGLDSGFDLFEESEDVPIDLTRSLLLEEAMSGDVEQFDEWDFDSKLDVEADTVEADTEAGAREDHSGTANDSDHDARPDVEVLSGGISPAASQVSQESATLAKNLVHFIASKTQYPPNSDNADTEILTLSGRGIASGLGQSMLQSIPLEQRCDCVKHPCTHDLNLRPRDKKEVANYGNVYDNDPTSDYEEDPNGTSASRIAREDMDEDESDNDDAGPYSMTGGLETRNSRMNDMFERGPYNQRDSCIRDKNTLHDELSADEVIEKPKKRKRAKQTSSRPSKKAKSNNRTIKRARESDDEDLITTQDDNGEVILIKEIKEIKETKKSPESQTIAQIMQRLATPHTTKLSYPITFNSPNTSCSLCNQRSYAFTGCGSRKIKVFDYGNGLTEIPNANEAGLPIPMKRKPAATNLCMTCTTAKMAILMCKTHSMLELDPVPDFDKPAAYDRMIKNQPAEEGEVWCSVCPLPALHSCGKNCGAKFCETCAIKVHTTHHEDLQAMLQATKDEITAEYRYGLRADVALLRGDGELVKFMKRHSKTNKPV
ncbi:hypothetical protein AUEXF2481DRAFT_352377 [Aureobasidium subglaciale EXF-2481]|uniref:C2H2-type domain-containing protein n=1 Tax=Aureobasidium subglaciale (strain EXF-2481) TaxID=1043005 RepID=A0A074Z205_AURSE|nr:uncharacterized protein AUEXF2481DRAFT_352377 [Aureobasidium subglaciale EXF-2481]KEQ93086.1 hypothetical protein AUEXF2481DRAFT_352377 [Aureobasidium subglaciale EXF-2481]